MQARVIEPTEARSSAPADDAAFVLARGSKSEPPLQLTDYPIHLAEKWYTFRAQHLGLSIDGALARDASISESAPPGRFWDEQTSIEAVSIWSTLCNECHGGRRRIKDAEGMPSPNESWGRGDGLFFGKRRPYREVFATIARGGPERNGKPSEMPAWRTRLSKEQIWSLIYFLEYQSGGIEGVFPPSLYPRGPE